MSLRVLLFILFTSSSLYMLRGSIKNVSVLLMMLSLTLITFLVIIKRIKYLKVNKAFLVSFYLLTFVGVLSSLVNADIVQLFNLLGIVALYVSLTISLPNIENKKLSSIIYQTVFFSSIILIANSLIFYGIKTTSYKGMFDNSNSFGITSSTLFIAIISYLSAKIEDFIFYNKKLNKGFFINCTIAAFTLLLTVMSSSRTSVLTSLAIGVFLSLLVLSKHIKVLETINILKLRIKKSTIRNFLMSLSVLCVSFLLVWYQTSFRNVFYNSIVNKFVIKSGQSDGVLDSRQYIWEAAIKESTLLGSGSNFFKSLGMGSSHNTFINLLGQYGWIFLLLFLLIIIIGLYYSIKYMFNIEDDYRYLPIALTSAFIMMSMTEGMLMKLSMTSMFACFGVVSVYKRRSVSTQSERLFSYKEHTVS